MILNVIHFLYVRLLCFQFNREGFAIIEDFCTEEEIQIMRSAMADIVDHFDPDEHRNIFKATEQVCNLTIFC